MVQIKTSCRVWKSRYQRECKRLNSRPELIPVNSGGLSPLTPLRFLLRLQLSQNANCRSKLPEMLVECSIAFLNIQEYYLFLALYISKINRRTKKFKKKKKKRKEKENTKIPKHIRLKSSQKFTLFSKHK